MKFQDTLQVLRKQKGMSQEKLAEKIGISRQAVANWDVVEEEFRILCSEYGILMVAFYRR